MKKIIIILSDGTERMVGYATSIYEFILEVFEMIIVPFHGHNDYVLVHNVYNPDVDAIVTYKSEKIYGWSS